MVDKKLIVDTISELLDANIDKDTIYDTLKEIGVDLADIEKNYKEVIESRENKKEKIVEEVDAVSEEDHVDTKPLKNTTKTNFIEKNKDRNEESLENELKETTNDIEEINEKEDKIETKIKADDNNLKEQLLVIEEQVSELKAQIKALTKIMKDILEENRNILNKL